MYYITQSTLFLRFIRDGSVYISHTIVVASRASSRDVQYVGTQLNWLYSKIVSDAGVRVPVVTSSYALLQADGCSVITVRASSSNLTDTTRPGLWAGGSGVYLSCHRVHQLRSLDACQWCGLRNSAIAHLSRVLWLRYVDYIHRFTCTAAVCGRRTD